MITVRPFQPVGATQSVAVGTTAAAIALAAVPRGTQSVRCVNTSTAAVFIGFGESEAIATAAATTAAGMPMLQATVETFQIRNSTTHIAVIGTEVAGNFYVTLGESA